MEYRLYDFKKAIEELNAIIPHYVQKDLTSTLAQDLQMGRVKLIFIACQPNLDYFMPRS